MKDTYDNLFQLMTFVSYQINNLERLILKQHKFRVFICGDYDFLAKVYGISGAQGKHPCIWCNVTSDQIKQRNGHMKCEKRTLERMGKKVNEFEDIGMAQKGVAKEFENCINRPMIQIEIRQVVIPYLHCLLGLMKRHHELLEYSAHYLDKKLLEQDSYDFQCAAKYRVAFSLQNFGGNWQKAVHIRQCMDSVVTEGKRLKRSSREIKESLAIHKDQLKNLPKTELLERQGPVAYPLDKIMTDSKVKEQPFYKRSYLGNDCHMYF